LPAEVGDEPEGAVGGDIWEALASIKAQAAFFSRLLNEIERYTDASETTQRSIRDLAPALQWPVQAKLQKKAQHLQDQLAWAEKALAPQAISNAKLEQAFRARPLIPVTLPIHHLCPARPAPELPLALPQPPDGN
jgi:hypothetical protein